MAVLAGPAWAETWGLASFTPPSGWKREQVGEALGYTRIEGQRWGRIVIYGAVPSRGERDLEADWQEIVVPAHHPSSFERGESKRGQGFTLSTGGGTFPFNGGEALVMLFTFTLDSGSAQSVVFTGGGKDFVPALTRFVESLRFAGKASAPPVEGAPPPPVATTKGGFQFTTTNFDDGWVATATDEGVALTKGPLRAFVHFPIAWTDETRRWGDEQRLLFFWNRLLSSRWRVPKVTVRPTPAGVGMISFGEGDGTDAQGTPAHVALAHQSENGNAYVVEVGAPDVASFRAALPTLESIMALRNMNKFDVAPRDLEGTWAGGGGAFNEYVNTTTGLSAGWSGAAVSDTFTFSGGRFTHAWTGFVQQGGMGRGNTGKRQGRFSVSSWTVTLTDDEGKTDTYRAQFELVRGGRVLHLVHQKFSGQAYHLVRR
ncbi:MAG: hypothetical protein ACOZQL_36765 [Myxococcota bacterium]